MSAGGGGSRTPTRSSLRRTNMDGGAGRKTTTFEDNFFEERKTQLGSAFAEGMLEDVGRKTAIEERSTTKRNKRNGRQAHGRQARGNRRTSFMGTVC